MSGNGAGMYMMKKNTVPVEFSAGEAGLKTKEAADPRVDVEVTHHFA